MVDQNQNPASKSSALVKWALILGGIVVLLWLGAYLLGVQIYDAALNLTH
jgi:hypothetical protein